MAGYIKEYFQTGQLPPRGKVCEANVRPFLGVTKSPASEDEMRLLEDLRWMAAHWD